MTKIIVNGATGKMGQMTVATLEQIPDFKLVAALSSKDNLKEAIEKHRPDIVVDFTVATVSYENTKTIINANVHPVIGSTGLTKEQLQELQTISREKKLGGIIAPNFSIGAILAMRFAKEAARFYSNVEIIEYHHDKKLDAPSGTAIKTAEMIAETREFSSPKPQHEIVTGSRGATLNGIPIHAVRLPGIVAKEEIIFGAPGETLTIQHNAIDRSAFMQGVVLACQKVLTMNELVYGLEVII